MKLVSLLLADAVNETPDGRLNLLGAGLTHINAPQFPATGALCVVARFEISSSEWIGSKHKLALRMMDEDGRDVLPQGRLDISFDLPTAKGGVDRESFFNQVLRLEGFSIPRPGRYRAIILLDGHEAGSAPLTAVKMKTLGDRREPDAKG